MLKLPKVSEYLPDIQPAVSGSRVKTIRFACLVDHFAFRMANFALNNEKCQNAYYK